MGKVIAESGAPMEPFAVRPIGWVESPLTHRAAAPRQGTGAPPAWLVIDPGVATGIRDLRVGDAVVLLSWLDRADRGVLSTVPGDDPGGRERGVFSTRSPDRPNPIGLHQVCIRAIEGLRIFVQPLELLDGTPILDIKPVLDPIAEG